MMLFFGQEPKNSTSPTEAIASTKENDAPVVSEQGQTIQVPLTASVFREWMWCQGVAHDVTGEAECRNLELDRVSTAECASSKAVDASQTDGMSDSDPPIPWDAPKLPPPTADLLGVLTDYLPKIIPNVLIKKRSGTVLSDHWEVVMP